MPPVSTARKNSNRQLEQPAREEEQDHEEDHVGHDREAVESQALERTGDEIGHAGGERAGLREQGHRVAQAEEDQRQAGGPAQQGDEGVQPGPDPVGAHDLEVADAEWREARPVAAVERRIQAPRDPQHQQQREHGDGQRAEAVQRRAQQRIRPARLAVLDDRLLDVLHQVPRRWPRARNPRGCWSAS
jgi:hypothetical protein